MATIQAARATCTRVAIDARRADHADMDSQTHVAPLRGKTALITGASGGIGGAIARRLAGQGARIVAHYHTGADAAQALIAELGPTHVAIGADLCDVARTEPFVAEVVHAVGGIDILVNNAGLYERYPLMDTDYETWCRGFDRALDINLVAPARLSYVVARHMAERGGGRIVNVGSRGAYRGEPIAPGYGAAKAGLHALTQSLAVALAPHSIFVCAVAPGFVETAMARPYITGEMADSIRQQSPLGRVATVDDVAYFVACLVSDDASFATGAIIDVNGASHLR